VEKVPVKPDTEDRDQYGRNSKGQYLNHQAFVAHRNLLNEEEARNIHVFDIIQDKLTDSDYLTQVMDPNAKELQEWAPGSAADAPSIEPDTDNNVQLEAKALSAAQMQSMLGTTMTMEAMEGGVDDDDDGEFGGSPNVDMETETSEDADPSDVKGPAAQEWPDDKMPTDYDAQCYLERYKDLGHLLGGWDLTKAKMHWMEHGRFEGRWMQPCGLGETNPMSREEAKCYKERYSMNPNLQKQPLERVPNSYAKWGRPWGFNRFCAPRITFWQSYCMLARSPDLQSQFGKFMDKVDMTDFRLMRYWQQYGYFEGRDPSCGEFGGDFYKCAKHGEDCQCPHGHVYFGRSGKRGVTFTAQRMLEEGH
jgi:hypothetical protein